MKKRKKFGRKLRLNKETISKLSSDHTKEVVGGRPTGPITCTWAPGCATGGETYCEITVCLVCPCEEPITYIPTDLC